MQFVVYIMYSASRDRYYTGQTSDLSKRISQHNAGYDRYTRSGIPWELKYTEEYQTRREAMRREREIKAKKSRSYLEGLIRKFRGERPE
ncbi:MAG: GIY-YIG nuclease family protein, partial [Fidelibacterota bacterium]